MNIGRDQYASLLLASSPADLKNGHKLRGLGAMAGLLMGRPLYLEKAIMRKGRLRGIR